METFYRKKICVQIPGIVDNSNSLVTVTAILKVSKMLFKKIPSYVLSKNKQTPINAVYRGYWISVGIILLQQNKYPLFFIGAHSFTRAQVEL